MDRRITPDNGDIDSPSQTGQPRLPRRSTPNVDVRSPSQGGRPHLPHQSTPDVDTHSPSQVGHSNLPHRSTPDNINARSPSLTEHRDLPHQSTPDVDIYSQSHAGHSGSGLPRQITPEDVDTRWPFRAGYPRLLRPSVVSIPIEDEAEKPISDADIDRLQSRITEILDSYDLPWCTSLTPLPEVVYRRQKFGTFGLPRVLIHCNYDKDTSYSKKWTEAVVEIYSETQSVVKGDCEVGVELVDKAIMNSQICSLPTPMSQELSANWEIGHNYCEQILHLFEAPHDMFQVMVPIGRCVRRTGLFYDRDPTCEWTAVVFFDALNAEDVLWDSLEERIRSILPSHIDIEIRQRSGPVFYSPPSFLDKYVEGRIPSPEEYVRPPQPGCDIGVQGSRSAGTMGGYVATEDKNGKRTTYGITNAHVVLQSYEKCVFSASADSGIRIVSPSEMSRTEAKSELLKQIPRLENQIPIHKEIIDAWEEEDPDLVQRRKKVLESVESELASAKRTLELIEQEPYVGSVHNASIGDTVYSTASSQCEIMMDLALIKMHCPGAERPQQIYLKEKIKPPRILPHATCDTWETDSLGVSHDGDGKNHIKVVGKLSRTGVYTFGIVNDFRAVAFPFTENGVENKKKHYMWVVSNPASYSKQKPFSRAGDAGSFVIAAADWEYCDYDNRVAMPSPQAPLKTRYKSTQPFVVGLLFGRTGDEELSYFIPFDAVKSEIESLTGEEMVWPQKRSDCVRDDVA